MSTLFKRLNAIDCSKHVEKKGKFSYLSWTWAWQMLKEHCPDATFEKHTFLNNEGSYLPYMRDLDGYAFVQTSVTADGITLTETFPVLNNVNKSIQKPKSFEVNTALQRCLTKTIAFHGLGLYIYAGEDLPEDAKGEINEKEKIKEQINKIGKMPQKETGIVKTAIIQKGLDEKIISEKSLKVWSEEGWDQQKIEARVKRAFDEKMQEAIDEK
jgi:hypothetical protein